MPVSGADAEMEMKRERAAAFTLIELLVVIVIIAVLMGLAFPVFQTVMNQARKTQARNDLTQIVTAVNAFYTEYGKYPLPPTANNDAAATYGTTNNSGNLFTELRGKSGSLNTRLIVFISPPEDPQQTNPKGKIGKDGQFYDPWGSAYSLQMDADYNNEVPNPYGADKGAGPDPIRQGVTAWSLGKNGALGGGTANAPFSNESGTAGVYAGSGDVISWQ
jgi:prepilin-type N-terminal cleavage/methylation domain-containing protein